MNIKINVSESDFNRLANDIDTSVENYIVHNCYGNIIVDDKLSFDVTVMEDFNNGYYRMNLEIYDLASCEIIDGLKYYEDVTDVCHLPLSDIENNIDLYHGYEAFKKSVIEAFNEFIEEV